MKLKIPIIKNKKNKQISLYLPKRKIPKRTLKRIEKNKYINLRIL